MPRRNALLLIIILIILILAAFVVFPMKEGVRLGLDLVGGIHLVYQVQFPAGTSELDKAKDMDRTIATIQSRIDRYGVVEPVIQRQGSDRILIQLPGFTDLEQAKKLVEQTGFLEFREVELDKDGKPVYLSDYLNSDKPDFVNKKETGSRIFVNDETGNPVVFIIKDKDGGLKYVDENGNPVDIAKLKPGPTGLVSWMPARGDDGTQLTGSFLAKAEPNVSTGTKGAEAQIDFEWNSQGAEIFDQVARRLYNSGSYGSIQRALGIFLDNKRISYPQIMEQAYYGKGSITGNFALQEAQNLATLLQSGALPIALQKPPLYQGKVTPTLGADFINRSVKAGAIGLFAIMLFMVLYYRLPGVLASLALAFYAVVILALFKLWPGGGVTLTLAGLGGFILSLGMAVDANVLIFERMKEELWAGQTLGAAIDAGFDRAWSAIRDSNLTTFIACGILYWLGKNVVASGPVMGFALTLFIGVAVSMFTAITVTRSLLRLFVGSRLAQKTSLFTPHVAQNSNVKGGTVFDIVNKRFWLLSFSGVVLVICIIAAVVLGLKPAVEFKSGSMMTASFTQPVEQAQLKQELTNLGYGNALIQRIEGGSFLIRTRELSAEEKAQLENALTEKFGRLTEDQFFSVSPLVATETVQNAAIAVAASLIGMLLYIAWAFRKVPNSFRYGTCAIAALLHDVVVIAGVFAIAGIILSWQVDLLFITGVLTIIGYAINNTIVVFDRIRENASYGLSSDFAVVVNGSIVQTLTRSLNTTITTIFAVLALMLFVGSSLQNLNVVLLVGLTAGFFSSVFVAPLLLLVWHGAGWGFKLKAT